MNSTKFLKYTPEYESQNIDINKLRPKKSYDFLVKNRNSSLNNLLKSKKKLKNFLQVRDCPSCRNKKQKLVIRKDGLKIVQCTKCSLIYVSPVFDYDHYIKLYSNKNYQKIVKKLGENSHQYRRKRFGIERLSILKNFYNKKKCNLLDIGCSTGFFIEEVKKMDGKQQA